MSNYIKNLVKSAGWNEIEDIFDKTIQDCHNNTVNEDLSAEEFKINVLANRKAAEMLKKMMKSIRLKGKDLVKEVISYK